MAETKPITTADTEGKHPKSAANAEKPTPTQAQADSIVEEIHGTAPEPAAKSVAKAKKAAEPTDDTPHPTQAELDAIKAGSYLNRETKSA